MDYKTTVIDGVTYQLPPEKYIALQEIISGARVMRDLRRSPAPCPRIAMPGQTLWGNSAPAKELKRILGDANYNECAIYDFGNTECLTDVYYGQDVNYDAAARNNAISFKQWFDGLFRLEDLTLKYGVYKQVLAVDYPGFAKWTDSNREIYANSTGLYIVCNFIVKGINNSLKLLSGSWIGGDKFSSATKTSQNIVSGGLKCGCVDDVRGKVFRQAVRAEYRRRTMMSGR